jgi:uncharacterized membrane protein
MYSLFLFLHSWMRWVAIVAGVLAVVGLVTNRASNGGNRWGRIFAISLDVQFLLGLLLYFVVSPNMTAIRANFGESMGTRSTRFWAVEHVTFMVLALVVLHMSQAMARKASSPAGRHSRLLIGTIIALLAILGGTPWPGTTSGRPLFRVSAQP